MAGSDVKITFTCKECGVHELMLPDNPSDDSIAICAGCGIAFGTYGEVKELAVQAVQDSVAEQFYGALAAAFKGSKHFTVTRASKKVP